MKTYLTSRILMAGVAAMIGTDLASAADGDGRNCSLKTLNRSYGVKVDGWYGSAAPFLPGSVVGAITFDGNGKYTQTVTIAAVLYGVVRGVTMSGTYTVNPDCTGTMTSDNDRFHFDLVIVSNGDEVFVINTDPPYLQTGVFKRQ
jgi:hypothetical protein